MSSRDITRNADYGSHSKQPQEARGDSPVTLGQAGWALLCVALYLGLFTGALLTVALLDLFRPSAGPVIVTFLLGATAVIYLALYLHLFRRNGLRFVDLGFRRPTRRMFHLFWQIPASILGALVLQILFLSALGPLGVDTTQAGAVNGPFADLPGISPALVITAFLVIAVLTPMWEEVLFRGAFLSGFLRRYRPWIAIVLSAALFAAAHLAFINFAGLFALGIAMALLRRFHGNLWAPILLHAANNALVLLIVLTVVQPA